jgi:hypothetical protein
MHCAPKTALFQRKLKSRVERSLPLHLFGHTDGLCGRAAGGLVSRGLANLLGVVSWKGGKWCWSFVFFGLGMGSGVEELRWTWVEHL